MLKLLNIIRLDYRIIRQSPCLQSSLDFIIAAPQSQTCMMPNTAYIVLCFLYDIAFKLAILVQPIHVATEHKIMPHQNAVSITGIIKSVILIVTATPYTDHVKIRPCTVFD